MASIRAAKCGLTGQVNGGPPSLVSLDLAWNNISQVQSIPARCKSLILTGNPAVTFGPGVLAEANQGGVSVDLQQVAFKREESCHQVKYESSIDDVHDQAALPG